MNTQYAVAKHSIGALVLCVSFGCGGPAESTGTSDGGGAPHVGVGSAQLMGSVGDGPFEPKSVSFANFPSSDDATGLVFSTDEGQCAFEATEASDMYPEPKSSQILSMLFLPSAAIGAVPVGGGLHNVEGVVVDERCVAGIETTYMSGSVDVLSLDGDTMTGTLDLHASGGVVVSGSFTAAYCAGLLADVSTHPVACQ